MITKQSYMKVACGFLVFLILALITIWILIILGSLHWVVGVAGTLGSSGCIATVLASIKQFKERTKERSS